jgi:hypothetical protein
LVSGKTQNQVEKHRKKNKTKADRRKKQATAQADQQTQKPPKLHIITHKNHENKKTNTGRLPPTGNTRNKHRKNTTRNDQRKQT